MLHIWSKIPEDTYYSENSEEEEEEDDIKDVSAFLFKHSKSLFPESKEQSVDRVIDEVTSSTYNDVVLSVITYIQKFHKDKLHLGLHSFIEESLIANENERVPTSCSKGIRESVVTALRVIGDRDLNSIFAKAEGLHLVDKKFNLLNLSDENMKTARAQDLIDLGISSTSTQEEINAAFKQMSDNIFKGDRLNKGQTTTLNEMIEGMIESYDDVLKPLIIEKTGNKRRKGENS
jgi:hypothetical protein